MSLTKGKFEGVFNFDINDLVCICAFCGETTKNGRIELDFKNQSISYICSNEKCRKNNSISLLKQVAEPYPKTRRS